MRPVCLRKSRWKHWAWGTAAGLWDPGWCHLNCVHFVLGLFLPEQTGGEGLGTRGRAEVLELMMGADEEE